MFQVPKTNGILAVSSLIEQNENSLFNVAKLTGKQTTFLSRISRRL